MPTKFGRTTISKDKTDTKKDTVPYKTNQLHENFINYSNRLAKHTQWWNSNSRGADSYPKHWLVIVDNLAAATTSSAVK